MTQAIETTANCIAQSTLDELPVTPDQAGVRSPAQVVEVLGSMAEKTEELDLSPSARMTMLGEAVVKAEELTDDGAFNSRQFYHDIVVLMSQERFRNAQRLKRRHHTSRLLF